MAEKAPRRCKWRARRIAWCRKFTKFCNPPVDYETCPGYEPVQHETVGLVPPRKFFHNVRLLRSAVHMCTATQTPPVETKGSSDILRCPRCGKGPVYEAYFMSSPAVWCWNCGLLYNLRTGEVYGENRRTGSPEDYSKNREIVEAKKAFSDPRQEAEIGGIVAPLKAGGFADVSIVGYIDEINAMGYKTVASCSGMRRDHQGHEESAYLSIELPEDVVTPGFGRTPHEVYPSQVKNWGYVNSLIKAGESVNWLSELSLYMLFIPTVHHSPPKTGSIENDRRAENEPSVIRAEQELDAVMGAPHTAREFMQKLDERDRIREVAYQKYGGRKSWSDEELDQMWRRLVTSIKLHGPITLLRGFTNSGISATELKNWFGPEIREMISEAESQKREIGAMLCRTVSGQPHLSRACYGRRGTVSVADCHDGLSPLGSFHTHLGGTDVFSVPDLELAIKKEQLSCLGYTRDARPYLKCVNPKLYYQLPYETQVSIKRNLDHARQDIERANQIHRVLPSNPEATELSQRAQTTLRQIESILGVYEVPL